MSRRRSHCAAILPIPPSPSSNQARAGVEEGRCPYVEEVEDFDRARSPPGTNAQMSGFRAGLYA